MVMPLLIVALQVLINQGTSRFSLKAMAPTHLAALGFGIAAYTMMFSAFQTLNAEGKALWMLYTLPRSLTSVLRDKAVMWAALAWSYPLGLFAAAAVVRGGLRAHELALLLVALVGVPIYALIAVSLGVFGANPLAEETQRKIKPTYAYLYLLLAALGSYAIYATSLWQRLALLVLTGTLAMALWQRARDRLPYLLDPGAAPPARVSLSDGMIAALAFMVLQALVALTLARRGQPLTGPQVLVSFVVAGAVVAVAARITFAANGVAGVPRLWGPGATRALGRGLAAGAAAAAFAIAYLVALPHVAGDWRLEQTQLRLPAAGPWLIVLAVVAAPAFEELIFRGLVYGGLRRSLPFGWAALASAAIFAVVHPPAGALPVFGLALAAAWAYERSGLLVAPMLAHAVYNGAVVTLQIVVPALSAR
jgi:ABC-2 type transport system permease protein